MARPAMSSHRMMGEVLEASSSAQRIRFGSYHLGGCNTFGFEPGHTFEPVAGNHNVLDVAELFVEPLSSSTGASG
jgi:hypothetical protein